MDSAESDHPPGEPEVRIMAGLASGHSAVTGVSDPGEEAE